MPTSAKQSPKPTVKRTTRQVAQPTAPPAKPAPAPERPFLRFYHSESLRAKTLAVLSALEQAQDSTRYRDALSDLVLELTDSGLDYYFMRPLKLAQVGFVTEQSAHLGMSTVKRVIAPVIRKVIGRMEKRQLLIVCSHIRQLMA